MRRPFNAPPATRRPSARTPHLRAISALMVALLSLVCPTVAQKHTSFSAAETKVAAAVDALFMHSGLDDARALAQDALDISPKPTRQVQLDALFVQMEAAALQADTHAELDAALRLCELRPASNDPRLSIAASRILDLAANTAEFRAAIPRIRALLSAKASKTVLSSQSAIESDLRSSLLSAAADGAPGLSVLDLAHESGLITDWRIAGPFGQYPNVAFEHAWEPERDGLTHTGHESHAVELFRFDSGEVKLADYFSPSGVFYAAAQTTVPAGGRWLLRIESPGTLQTWIDGTAVLTKDDRLRSTAETIGTVIPLQAGPHSVLVKFLPSAVPFRIALLLPSNAPDSQSVPATSAVERDYIAAARSFWSGDYPTAIEKLTRIKAEHDSAAVDVLLAQALSHAGDTGAEATPLLKAALKSAPSAYAAEYELAASVFADDRFADAFEGARKVLKSNPQFEPAAHLLASSAAKLKWTSEGASAFEAAAALHPSCTALHEASKFSTGISDYVRARQYESQLAGCAPGSLASAGELAASGRHAESATAARQVVTAHPLDRVARELLVRELALAGQASDARDEAHELEALAPNSRAYRSMAAQLDSGDELIDDAAASSVVANEQPFYTGFRRDGVDVAKQISTRRFSGGPAVILLNDRVAEVRGDGAVSVYVHTLTRVLDGYGIGQYGEVTIPDDADLVELRTIKADGAVVEPEFNQHKSSISMPALAPGDAIDEEYVIHNLEGGITEHPDAMQFTFGSFAAPIVLSRSVLLSPENANLKFVPHGIIPSVSVRIQNSLVTRIWEANDIAQFASEVSMPRSGVLPSVRVFAALNDGWADVRDFYRNEFIGATHIGSRVQALAREIPGGTDEQRLRAAYRLITLRVRSGNGTYESGDITDAEETLGSFDGSRTAALLALGREMGIPGDVLMTRNISVQPPAVPSAEAYNRPLLLFHVTASHESPRDIVLDVETEGIGFGGIAANIDRKDALMVPIAPSEHARLITEVPSPIRDEHSVADGDVNFDGEGNLTAHVTIRMGTARGAQMRSMLSSIDPADRKHFFEQLASRIFPGTTQADGQVKNENDSDNPLMLVVDCRAAGFADLGKPVNDLDQLVPALGLRGMYATEKARVEPLSIDTPLVETSTFRIHLPSGIQFAQPPPNFNQRAPVGSYSLRFRRLAQDTMEVRRDFNIPVQIVNAKDFDAFARFASNVENAEQLKLGLQQVGTAATLRGGTN